LKLGGHPWWRVHAIAGAAAAFCLAGPIGCKRPIVGAPTKSGQLAGGPEIAITGATVGLDGRVTVGLTLSRAGLPLSLDAALALGPAFTLAELSTHPVDGLAAWKSLLLTGSETAVQLRPAGPPTPPALVVSSARQPGIDVGGAFGGADGAFTYAFSSPLPPGFVPTDTFRVGVFLSAAAAGTRTTTATYDFRPAGGAPAPRDTVLSASCDRCHGMLAHHDGKRVGVKICLTCHTWQSSDPDTVDPAALDGATPATDPNPLELGRLVHRIHRGKNLPTLYQAAAGGTAVPAPALPSSSALPAPFFPGRNAPVAGRKFSVVGAQSRETVFGRVVSRTDNQMPARSVPEGVAFPRDLRECDACHGGAPQEYEVLYAASRRTCNGCHPEVWFDTAPITDAVHFAHTGGPQGDDTQCAGCHVVSTPPQKLYAPIADIHELPRRSPRCDRPEVVIERVTGLVPGGVPDGSGGTKGPTVVFKLRDRTGDLLQPNAPSPATDTAPTPSPVPRAFSSLTIRIAGPTAPDFSGQPALSSSDAGNPSPLTLVADAATHELSYTFASALPAGATGTWAVGVEGRRRATPARYDTATDTFNWPYTGEPVTESPDNAVVYVDTATGSFGAGAPDAAVPRRTVVEQDKCGRCHGERLELHGGIRHQIRYCVLCHTPDRTDWGSALGASSASGRPKLSPSGTVNLAGTFDGVEERSIHFKVLVHRIHTGGRTGAAALDLVQPFIVYGFGSSPNFFDDVLFPGDLRDCTLCHEGKSYLVEAVPAGAPATIANEGPTIRHVATTDSLGNVVPATSAHAPDEPAAPPVQAACLGCHATGAAAVHAASHTASGVEQCGQCHSKGSLSVDVAHGLASLDAAAADASFASISEKILVPRCASAACHGGNPPPSSPRLDAGASYDAIVQVPSQQASGLSLVEPFLPEQSYLLLKLRGDAGSVGGIATTMPLADAALDPSDIAAIEAWIANGAQDD
jgi:OmcA/MtrC family decaheme c-type cytochrome